MTEPFRWFQLFKIQLIALVKIYLLRKSRSDHDIISYLRSKQGINNPVSFKKVSTSSVPKYSKSDINSSLILFLKSPIPLNIGSEAYFFRPVSAVGMGGVAQE